MIIEQSLPITTQRKSDKVEFVVNSPGLNHFRLNPFQALRLSVTAIAAEAVWQAEKILPGLRLGLPPKGSAPISWLASVNEMEVQQAVQKIEEPLERLIEQLFWFDFDADAQGALLQEALTEADANKLSVYLQQTDTAPTLATLPLPTEEKSDNQDESTGEATSADVTSSTNEQTPDEANGDLEGNPDEASDVKEQTTEEESALTTEMLTQAAAHDLNRANLQLLLAVSNFHHVGPLIEDSATSSPLNGSSAYLLEWEKDEVLSLSWNPHLILAASPNVNGQASDWQRFWSNALSAWNQILNSPHFTLYVDRLIQELGDDLLDQGAVDTLKRAIPTRLADMLASEIRSVISEGTSGRVSQLVRIAGNAPFDPRIWQATFSSLNFFFQSELADLKTLIDEPDSLSPDTIHLYFERLGRIKERWQLLDPMDVIGLNKLLDEAVLQGYQCVSVMSYAGDKLTEVQELLDIVSPLASSLSLQERILSYRKQITAFHEHATCHFCEQRERDPNYPVVIKGKKETDRQWYGVGTSIRYSIKHSIIPRCSRCAEFQNYISNTGVGLCSTFVIILIAFVFVTYPEEFRAFWHGVFSFFTESWFFFVIGLLVILRLIHLISLLAWPITATISLFKRVISIILVPHDEKAFYRIKDTKGHKELISEGYHIVAIDLRRNALRNTLASSKDEQS